MQTESALSDSVLGWEPEALDVVFPVCLVADISFAMSEDIYLRKAERLLNEAARATNMKERGRLIDEAMHWHNLAIDKHDHKDGRTNDNAADDEGRETA